LTTRQGLRGENILTLEGPETAIEWRLKQREKAAETRSSFGGRSGHQVKKRDSPKINQAADKKKRMFTTPD